MVTVPAVPPVTSPPALTPATDALLVAHVTTGPASRSPAASWGFAASCTACPTVTLAVAGLTVTDATGTFVTVTVAVPFCPSLVAVMVAAPAALPVTSPLALTVAMAPLLVAHVTTRPVSTLPAASLGVAVNCTACPTVRLAAAGLTATDATGTTLTVIAAVPLWPSLVAVIVAVPAAAPLTSPLPLTDATGTALTVIAAEPLFPSLVAVIVAVPPPTPLTSPLPLTVVTAALLVAQLIVRPLNGRPVESSVVAPSCAVAPPCMLAVAGLTVTDATGTGVTVTTDVSDFPPGWPVAMTLNFPVSAPALYRP